MRAQPCLCSWVAVLAAAVPMAPCLAGAEEPLAVRLENFTVMPSTGPGVNVQVHNRARDPVTAVVRVRWPEGWQGAPPEQSVTVAPEAVARAAFTIAKAVDRAANRYEVVVEARAGQVAVIRTQQVVCATAPYLKPDIDGQLEDWRDAVPITFTTGGRATTVMTCWNRRQFCLAARVDEEQLTPLAGAGPPAALDAIQFAVGAEPRGPTNPTASPRHEFVVVTAEGSGLARCFRLLRPGDALRLARETRPLHLLERLEVPAAVRREGSVTAYEIALPLELVADLRPTPGRPFRFSLLAHDPGGTGLRDLGTIMNFWPGQRHLESWCRWAGAAFEPTTPFDSDVEFGFSSSIH